MNSNISKLVRLGAAAAVLSCSLAITAPAQLTVTNIGTAKEDLNLDFFPDNIKNPGGTNPYRVDGVVTSPDFMSTFGLGGGGLNVEIYIQDTNDNKGITIFFPQSVEPTFDASVLELGKKVTVSGFIGQHHGVRDIGPTVPSAQIIIDPAPAVPVNPVEDTIANILADAEGFESTLVVVTNVSITAGTWPGMGSSANITVDDGTGSIILRIDQDTDIDGQPEPTSPFNLTGIVTQFDTDTNMPSTGYQVQSRFYTDIEQNIGQVAPNIEITPSGQMAVGINEKARVEIFGTDQNAGDTLIFDAPGAPAGSVVNDLGGRQAEFLWTPDGTFASTTNNVTLRVDDGTINATTNLDIIVLSAELSSIVINEIHYDPAAGIVGDANGDGLRDARKDEFIEVYNNGLTDIDISGWTLRAVTNVLYAFAPGTILTGETAVVVFGGVDANAPNGGITGVFGGSQVLVSVPDWAPGLSNGGTDVNIRNDAGLLIRSVNYSGIGVDDQSITRDPDITGDFEAHSTADGSGFTLYSPGTFINGLPFPGSELSNVPPSLAALQPTLARIGEGAAVNISASDPNSDPITLTVSNAPSSAVFVDNGNGTGSLTYTGLLADAGITFDVEYTATDVLGASDTKIAVLSVPSVQYSGLIINEFLPDPNLGATEIDSNQDGVPDGNQDEFIEIVNNTLADLDLDGCFYSDDSGSGGHVFSPIVVPVGSAVVVFGGGSITNFNDSPAQLSTLGNLSLNNTGDTLSLFDPSSNLLDVVVYSDPGVPDAESLTRSPDVTGTSFVNHLLASPGNPISAGRLAAGSPFQTSLAPHVQDMRNGTTAVGITFTQVVAVAEFDGNVVTLTAPGLPANAGLVQNDNDTGTLTFTPDNTQTGEVVVAFVASDVDGAHTNSVTIDVLGGGTFGRWDYETGLEGWTTVSRLSNADWGRLAGAGAEGSSFFMEMDGFGFAVGEPSDDWLISPAIDMSTDVWNQASYYVQYNFTIDNGLLLGLGLLASTNYPGTGDPLAGGSTWDDLGSVTLPLSNNTWEQQFGALGAYGTATNLYLAFRYENEGANPGQTRIWRTDRVKLGVAATAVAPTINPPLQDQVTTVGNTVQFTVNATEPDGDLVTLTAQNAPLNGTFTATNGVSAASGLFVFTPSLAQDNQDFTVTFVASDVDGADTNVVIISVSASQDGEGNLLVSEIMQNPNGITDSNGEYFEIYNKGGQAVNINGWTISDADFDSHVINNGGPLTVAAKGFVVLGINGDTGTNGGTPIDYAYGSGWFLSNGADEVILVTPGGVEIDRVEYDGGATWPDPKGSSMELSHPSMDNNVGANWGTASTSWSGNTSGDNGSPNDNNPGWVPVDTDGDGMSDDYETTHFGGATNGVANADDDLDKMTNLGEFLANTNPNDSNSVFEVIGVVPSGSGSSITLGDTSPLRQYQVESSSDPVNPASWSPIGAEVMGNSGTTVINDSNTATNLDYRGKASLP